MFYSKKLLDSKLLEQARKSDAFYAICDRLVSIYKVVTLDKAPGRDAFLVKSGKQLVGEITPTESLGPAAARWIYTDEHDSTKNFAPAQAEKLGDFA